MPTLWWWSGGPFEGHEKTCRDVRVKAYIRSRNSRGSESSSEKDGSGERRVMVGSLGDDMLCDGLRRRTGRLGVCGGASIMVVSDELLLPDAERERDCGVDVREAIS